jgi:hypothetical protein
MSTAERLREVLHYGVDTGLRKPGVVAGCIRADGYRVIARAS